MKMKFSKNLKSLLVALGLFIAATVFVVAVNLFILRTSEKFIFDDQKSVPSADVAIILGARVKADGRLSDMLADRTITAFNLYKAGKVQKILMSGDHGTKTYDEVNAVKEYLLKLGVRPADLFLDHAGFDTYDSMYRAKEIFEVKSAIVVTQEFHLSRAVYIGRALGVDTYGFVADQQKYVTIKYNRLREIPARTKSFLDVLLHSKSYSLGKKIPITGDSKLSWD